MGRYVPSGQPSLRSAPLRNETLAEWLRRQAHPQKPNTPSVLAIKKTTVELNPHTAVTTETL